MRCRGRLHMRGTRPATHGGGYDARRALCGLKPPFPYDQLKL
jgi:hypothetical protein